MKTVGLLLNHLTYKQTTVLKISNIMGTQWLWVCHLCSMFQHHHQAMQKLTLFRKKKLNAADKITAWKITHYKIFEWIINALCKVAYKQNKLTGHQQNLSQVQAQKKRNTTLPAIRRVIHNWCALSFCHLHWKDLNGRMIIV